VSADGKRFLANVAGRTDEGVAALLIPVVLNWQAGLKKWARNIGPDLSIDWMVKAIFSAPLVGFPEFNEPLIDPIWRGPYAIAGLKRMMRDVLAEDCVLDEFQPAYIVSRGGEDMLVPGDQLTDEEGEIARKEDAGESRACLREIREYARERRRSRWRVTITHPIA
jgi:hypothetical protein